jgi:hypothetical protein
MSVLIQKMKKQINIIIAHITGQRIAKRLVGNIELSIDFFRKDHHNAQNKADIIHKNILMFFYLK